MRYKGTGAPFLADFARSGDFDFLSGVSMKTSVFVGVSLDGFIARRNGTYDFLPADGDPNGYDDYISTVDALVIGRNTFETVLAFPKWPYDDRRVVVLSTRSVDLLSIRKKIPGAGRVEQMSGDPTEIVSKLAARGFEHIYVDGGITVQNFLRDGMIQRIIINRYPVLIGDGIPLFGSLPHDVQLRHVSTQHYPKGLVKSEYEVVP
jgi:dihydrofolate reductase